MHELIQSEQDIAKNAEVVVSTCDTSGNVILRDLRFKTILIDEASQAVEPETMVPIVHGAERVIIVGDHRQLDPVVLSKRCRNHGYMKTLMDRLIDLDFSPVILDTQYRMHPVLAEFSNHHYYMDVLKNGVTEIQRPILQTLPYPNKTKPLFFWDVEGKESVSSKGISFQNLTEGTAVIRLIQLLVARKIKKEDIGVITSYAGQKQLIINLLVKSNLKEVEAATVNTFQGREKDYIIFSCVRSNPSHIVGFLNNSRRLNVAITRARFGLFVIGNRQMMINGDLEAYMNYHVDLGTIIKNI